ncbi:MAG: ribosome hibernation-promoting factor, HPF/YfiA family [Aggregatilineales bacterium]
MNVQIHARNLEVNDRLRDYVEQKLSRLDQYLPSVVEVRVDISHNHRRDEGDRSSAQLTVRDGRGTILRAEEKQGLDVFAAVDAALDKLYRQISRYKDKRRRRAGRNFDALEPEWMATEPPPGEANNDVDTDEEAIAHIVRRKPVLLAPMSEDEAIDQLELLGHTFFVFYNANKAAINVLYKRDNGDYGLLEPSLG